ncbi:MAG: hypothetical protein ACLU4P_02855 [Ruminococcus sp.]
MEECRTPREYAQYVDKVRRYSNEMELNTAVERAVSGKHSGGNSQRISAKESSGGGCYGVYLNTMRKREKGNSGKLSTKLGKMMDKDWTRRGKT